MSKNEVAPNFDMIKVLESVGDRLKVKTYINNIRDFSKGDLVVCSLLKGVYKVEDINVDSERILLIHVIDQSHIPIKCKYVRKLENSTIASKALFEK